MKNWFSALLLALCLGCATAIVRPYVGEQQSWPTATGSIVNTKYDLPIFTSLPPSPYEVLGELRIESALYPQPQEGHLPGLVEQAKKIGADAIVFVDGGLFFSTNYGARPADVAPTGGSTSLTQVNSFNPDSFKPGVTLLAIKWRGAPPPGLPSKFAKAQTGIPWRAGAEEATASTSTAPVTSAVVAAPPPAPASAQTGATATATAPIPPPPSPAPSEQPPAPPAPPIPPGQPEPVAPVDTNAPSAAPVQFH
jgi:hypothetical protein